MFLLIIVSLTGCLGSGYSHPLPPETTQASESFQLPLKKAVILSKFGPRSGRFHTGIDLRDRRGGGDAIYASRAGRVVYSGKFSSYGNFVSIKHEDGFVTRYAHMRKILVRKNQKVKAGQQIGIVGSTGRATTAHLHFEILTPKSRFLDPYPYLFKKG